MPASTSIEDIILRGDRRGVSALRPQLVSDFCTDAARYVLDHPGPVLIATGFYIVYGHAIETDGPPGALAIGRALEAMGRNVAYVTDRFGVALMRGLAGANASVIEFPIADRNESTAYAARLLAEHQPALLISIERCAPSADGAYRNMRSVDIAPQTAKIDALFDIHAHTVGIGDGGNEIGMGALADAIRAVPELPNDPAATACRKLVIASVSNWGGYGLLAALSLLVGRDLLPSVAEEAGWVRRCVELGAVDGTSGDRAARVDGFDLDDYSATLAALHRAVADGLQPVD